MRLRRRANIASSSYLQVLSLSYQSTSLVAHSSLLPLPCCRCLGSYPRSDPLQEEFEGEETASAVLDVLIEKSDKLDSRGAIRVNSFLQVIGCSNVYAAGDVTVHAQHTEVRGEEERT